MPLDLRRKLLFRLCLRLCDREAIRRLTKLREVVSEFARIERICRHGEKWTDKVSFGIMSGARGLFFVFRKVSGGLRRHWILSLLCIVLLCGAVWYFRPEPPFDITQVKSKTYTHAELGLEMEIPVEWEVLSGDTVLKMLNEMQEENEELSEVDRNRMEFLRMLLEQRCDYIVCGYDEEFMENIAIQTVDVPGDILWDAPDDEIRLGMQQLFRGDLGLDMKIHEFRRQSLAGQRCIFVDLSQSSEARINNYVFALEDKCVSIALAVREENFPRRREEFDSVLSTLRFVK